MSIPDLSPSPALYAAILARRSGQARALAAPGPDAETVAKIVTAAARAPDHGRLVPFRFLEIAGAGRARLADLIEAATLSLFPGAARGELDRAREKAEQGPVILALIARIDAAHPKITGADQWLSVGCALENLLLAVQSFGFAAAIRSGAYLNAAPMREGFKLATKEELVSLVAIGTPSDWPPDRGKPALDQVFARWEG